MSDQEEKCVTATEAMRMLGWTRKYFYKVLNHIEESEDVEFKKSRGFPSRRLIPVSLITTLKSNWKKPRWGGPRNPVEKPGFLDDD